MQNLVAFVLLPFFLLNKAPNLPYRELDRSSSSKAKKKGSTKMKAEESSKLVSVSNANADPSPGSNDEFEDTDILQSEFNDAKSDGLKDEAASPTSETVEKTKAKESGDEDRSPKFSDTKDNSDDEPIVCSAFSLLFSSTPFMLDLADNNHSSNVNKTDAECMETKSNEAVVDLILRIQP